MEAHTVNSNRWNSNYQFSTFSKDIPIIRIFCICGYLAVPINPDRWSSTVLIFKISRYIVGMKGEVDEAIWRAKERCMNRGTESQLCRYQCRDHENRAVVPLPRDTYSWRWASPWHPVCFPRAWPGSTRRSGTRPRRHHGMASASGRPWWRSLSNCQTASLPPTGRYCPPCTTCTWRVLLHSTQDKTKCWREYGTKRKVMALNNTQDTISEMLVNSHSRFPVHTRESPMMWDNTDICIR